jgi:hypothetical protein
MGLFDRLLGSRSNGVKNSGQSEPAKAKTVYDVIKHLIGSCKGGSIDLATNPKHMEGYGR